MMRSCASVERAFQALHIVQIFLNQDITAAGKRSVLVPNKRGLKSETASWILRAIDKSDEVPILKIAKSLNLVGNFEQRRRCFP